MLYYMKNNFSSRKALGCEVTNKSGSGRGLLKANSITFTRNNLKKTRQTNTRKVSLDLHSNRANCV